MKHSLSSTVSGRLLIVCLALAAALGGWPIASGTSHAMQEATPGEVAAPLATIDVLELIDVPAGPGGGLPYVYYLSLINFEPLAHPDSMDEHMGQFTLTILTGAVCYEVGTLAAGTTVTAVRSGATTAPGACGESPDLACVDRDVPDATIKLPPLCTLAAGDIIYLPAGSSLTQIGNGEHFYANVDNVPASAHLSGYEFDDPGAGCRGSCY